MTPSLLILLCLIHCGIILAKPLSLKIINHSGAAIEVFWLNYKKNDNPQRVLKAPIRNFSEQSISTHDTHRFKITFLDHIDNAEVIVTARSDFPQEPEKTEEVIVTIEFDQKTNSMRAVLALDHIEDMIENAKEDCIFSGNDCFEEEIVQSIKKEISTASAALKESERYRDKISAKLRNYVCADDDIETSNAVSTQTLLESSSHNKSYTANVLLNTPRAKIWTIPDFITDDECDLLEAHVAPNLHRATVSSADGSSVISENRKASQGTYQLSLNKTDDPLWPLYTRIIDVTNEYTGFSLNAQGQEAFTVIEYSVDDEYKTHCDGGCQGAPYLNSGRVATAVLYCKAATRGGGTTFSTSDLFVKPTRGMGTFFSYKGADGFMDTGYTQHSGCPVREGRKLIATAWMREGVSETNSHNLYDTRGKKKMSREEEQLYKKFYPSASAEEGA